MAGNFKMLGKNSDLILALFPFCMIVIAAAIGLNSDFDLFCLKNIFPGSELPVSTIHHNFEGDL